MQSFKTNSTKFETLKVDINSLMNEDLNQIPLIFSKNDKESVDNFQKIQNWIESQKNYFNSCAKTKLQKENEIKIFFDSLLEIHNNKDEIYKLIFSLATDLKQNRILYTTIQDTLNYLNISTQSDQFKECLEAFHCIIRKNLSDLIFDDFMEEEYCSLESIFFLLIEKTQQIIENPNTKVNYNLIKEIILILSDIYSFCLPVQKEKIDIKVNFKKHFSSLLEQSGYLSLVFEFIYYTMDNPIGIFWNFYKNTTDYCCNSNLIYFNCFCKYIEKEPTNFINENESQLIHSTDYILETIKNNCLNIKEKLSQEISLDNYNKIHSISNSIFSLRALYSQANLSTSKTILKTINYIGKICSENIEGYLSLLLNSITFENNGQNYENLKFCGKFINNIITINSSCLSSLKGKNLISIISDLSIEEIEKADSENENVFIQIIFDLNKNSLNIEDQSKEYNYLLERLFKKAIEEIKNQKINALIIKIIFECISINMNLIDREFENIFDILLVFLEDDKNKIKIAVNLRNDSFNKICANLLQYSQQNEHFKNKVNILVNKINLISSSIKKSGNVQLMMEQFPYQLCEENCSQSKSSYSKSNIMKNPYETIFEKPLTYSINDNSYEEESLPYIFYRDQKSLSIGNSISFQSSYKSEEKDEQFITPEDINEKENKLIISWERNCMILVNEELSSY